MLDLEDTPDLVVIQVYITSAYRAYAIADHYRRQGRARRARRTARDVAAGGGGCRTPTRFSSVPAKTPGRRFSPTSGADVRRRVYRSIVRTLGRVPPIRRDLLKRHLYLVPNSIVVSRGCPHVCDFCYKEAFFEGGRSFYTQTVDAALAEIDRLPGRHLYFLDDHLFGAPRFAEALFDGMRGMGRLWQAAGTVNAVLRPGLLERAVDAGLRSLFVGFETLNADNLVEQRKYQNLRRDYGEAIRRLHDLGVMINGSFVFGMDGDDGTVFDRTVAWAIEHGIETATFHILTPYPGHGLYRRMRDSGADDDATTGTCTTRAMRSSVRRGCGRGTRSRLLARVRDRSTGGDRSSAGRRRTTRVGRSSSSGLRGRVEEVRAGVGSRHPPSPRRHDAAGARGDFERVRQAAFGYDWRASPCRATRQTS